MTALLIDLNQIVIAAASAIQSSSQSRQEFTKNFMRHVVLSSIKNLRTQFLSEENLETILCCDDKSTWRKAVFPYYKANRAKIKAEMPFPWEEFQDFYSDVKEELKLYFPYKLIQVEGCEGDDVVAVLTHHLQDQTKVIIASTDGDFAQLHVYPSVSQWSHRDRKWLRWPNPSAELIRKVVCGDVGDGVPNILSEDDTFVTPKKRQKSMTQDKLKLFYQYVADGEESKISPEIQKNLERNKKLITLSEDYIPKDLQREILDKYTTYEVPKGKVHNYLFEHNLKFIMNNLRGLV